MLSRGGEGNAAAKWKYVRWGIVAIIKRGKEERSGKKGDRGGRKEGKNRGRRDDSV
jgi:hypothetical protein